MPTGMHTLLNW